jgi:hypothetical protein
MKFTPKVRKAIYAAVAGLVPLLVIGGLITDEQSQAIMTSVAAFLTLGATILAGANVPDEDNLEPPTFPELEDFTEIETPNIPGQN